MEAREHEDGRASVGESELARASAEDLDELVMDDADDLLAGVERFRARGAVGLLAHLGRELPDDGERDVGVDEGASDLRDRLVDVGLGEDSATAQLLEGLRQPIGEVSEH